MTISRFLRYFTSSCGLVGVSIQIHDDGWGMLLYYTVLSNILVFSSLIFFIIYDFKKGMRRLTQNSCVTRVVQTMAILITGVIYHILLAPITEPEKFWTLRNFLVHYIVPWGLVLDTLIFDAKKAYRLREPIYWSVVPLSYFAFALLNGLVLKLPIPGAKDSPFAYFFINVNKFGWNKVLVNVLVISAGYIAVGYLLYLLKKFIGRKPA
ncbi:MAG: Pr6Pr family membrane protein [Streptococcus sp.]